MFYIFKKKVKKELGTGVMVTSKIKNQITSIIVKNKNIDEIFLNPIS